MLAKSRRLQSLKRSAYRTRCWYTLPRNSLFYFSDLDLQAEQKREKDIQQKLNETFENIQELKSNVSSNILTENPSLAARLDNPSRSTYFDMPFKAPADLALKLQSYSLCV